MTADRPAIANPEQQLAEDLGVEISEDIPVVREVSPEESTKVRAACMAELGWVSDSSGASEVSYEIPRGQEKQFNEAFIKCAYKFPIGDKYLVPLSTNQYTEIYQHLVTVTIPCLEDLGYDPESPPSLQTYLSTVDDPSKAYFVNRDIYPAVERDVEAGRWSSPGEVFDEICPMRPPDSSLYTS